MQEEHVRAFLDGELGRAAKYKKLDPTLVVNKTPESFNPFFLFLEKFRDTVERNFDVYWVDGGKPEPFSVAEVEPALVTFSSRYIELVFVFRQILGDPSFDGFRSDAIARTALRVMAEFAVHDRNLEFAEQAFIRSLNGERRHVVDSSGLWIHELSNQPIDEGFVANWFFSLAHELGHLNISAHPEWPQQFFSEKDTLQAIDFALTGYNVPVEVESAIRKSIKNPSSPLSPRRLAEEAYADFFAIQIILRATPFLMEKAGAAAILHKMLVELEQCMTTLWILERCKASSQWAARTTDLVNDAGLYIPPVAFSVRNILVRRPLEIAVTHLICKEPTAREWLAVKETLKQISQDWKPLLDEVLNGLMAANEFVFLPNEKRRSLTQAFTHRSMDLGNKSVQAQIKYFCLLIESLHGEVEWSRSLRGIVKSMEDD